MIKTIIFDIGRVLVEWDWEGYVKRIIPDEEKAVAVGRAFFQSPYYIEFDRNVLTPQEVVEKITADNPQYGEVFRLIFSRYGESIRQFDYTIPWIEELRAKGFKVLYLSNYAVPMRNQTQRQLSFIDYMDGGIFSCDIKLVKPDCRIYETLLNKYSLKAEECVFVDDMEINIEGAQRVGMKGIVFKSYDEACDEMERMINAGNC